MFLSIECQCIDRDDESHSLCNCVFMRSFLLQPHFERTRKEMTQRSMSRNPAIKIFSLVLPNMVQCRNAVGVLNKGEKKNYPFKNIGTCRKPLIKGTVLLISLNRCVQIVLSIGLACCNSDSDLKHVERQHRI